MEIKEVVDGWKRGELSGDAAIIVIHDILYPAEIDQDDIEWAKTSLKNSMKEEVSSIKEMDR